MKIPQRRLRNIIRESIKELMNEQSPGNPSGPYPPNFNPSNWSVTFDQAMGASSPNPGQYPNSSNPNVNCTNVINKIRTWLIKIGTSSHQKQKNMLLNKVDHARANYCGGYPYYSPTGAGYGTGNTPPNPGICGLLTLPDNCFNI